MVNMYAQYIFCIVTFQMGDRDLHANCKVTNHHYCMQLLFPTPHWLIFLNHNPEIFVVLMVEQYSKDLKYKINIYISILLLTC